MDLSIIIISILSIACLIILMILAWSDESWRNALVLYLLGWMLCIGLVANLDNAKRIAKKNDIDFAIVEALAEVIDHSNYDVATALSITGTDNIQNTFNLTDDEMIAVTVLIEKNKN